ncbi:hypothetical protein B0O99DRAFT_607819 [Bisporella sp. PMI_857]|nr:hypothetical protein B0O99DRAFT_607819 [Bisporella sp. PMI_857]
MILILIYVTWALIYIVLLGCAVLCWENTKYISRCLDDMSCLCNEVQYQNSVFQCLYSQCETMHFGAAVHYAITQCSGFGGDILLAVRPYPNHDSLRRRREAEYLAGDLSIRPSGSPSANIYPIPEYEVNPEEMSYALASINGYSFATGSVNNDVYPTQSANYASQSAANPVDTPTSPSPYFPLQTGDILNAMTLDTAPNVPPTSTPAAVYNTEPAAISAVATYPVYSAISGTEPGPVLFTGESPPKTEAGLGLPLVVTFAALFLVF